MKKFLESGVPVHLTGQDRDGFHIGVNAVIHPSQTSRCKSQLPRTPFLASAGCTTSQSPLPSEQQLPGTGMVSRFATNAGVIAW